MSIEILPYTQEHENLWNDFCAGAANATFLYSRTFLSYHENRFKDLSIFIMESGRIVGLFPAAESPLDSRLVISHPGITYGGIVHDGWLCGSRMIQALSALSEYYSKVGYLRLVYKAIPYIYSKSPAQDDLYGLFRARALRTRCDLSCAIDLTHRRQPGERRRRSLKKAQKTVTLSSNLVLLDDLWKVIAKNLDRKYDTKPVHSLKDLKLLTQRFPENIIIRCALIDGQVEAGVIFFNSCFVWHAQYIAASERAYDVSALDAVFDSAIREAHQVGVRYFDFGTSNEDDGKVLNDGLYRFKSEFGGGGVIHEFFELSLADKIGP